MNNQAQIQITTTTSEPSYTPNEAQTERAEARRRFNRLYIYTPIFLLTAVILVLTGFMVWSIFAPTAAANASRLSGLADLILIMVLLPSIIIWGVIVGLPIAYYVNRYQEQRTEPTPDQIYVRQYGRFRLILWQIDHKVEQLSQLIQERILPAIAQPIIRAHALGAALKAWWMKVKR
jgi:heme/copper-type cytochrome/quinol oxidase subunit 2